MSHGLSRRAKRNPSRAKLRGPSSSAREHLDQREEIDKQEPSNIATATFRHRAVLKTKWRLRTKAVASCHGMVGPDCPSNGTTRCRAAPPSYAGIWVTTID